MMWLRNRRAAKGEANAACNRRRRAEARDVFAPVYRWFTEDSITP
jgi:hypothetical protein